MPASPSVELDVDGNAMRTVYDRTSYNIIPTPPSPSHSSPTLTQSTSNSHSSGSPPQPTTPPRPSRSRPRYPDLGRVPLHRRGTSKTYERLEDLLREAGYKETRVFTPEGERGEGDNDEKKEQRNNVRGGMGAVVGFLAGLVHSSASTTKSTVRNSVQATTMTTQGQLQSQSSQPVYSPPTSPLTRLQALRDHGHDVVSAAMNSSTESLQPTPRPQNHTSSRPRTPVHPHSPLQYQQQTNYPSQPDQEHNGQVPPRPHLPRQSSRTSVHRQNQLPVHAPTPLRLNSFSNSHPYSHGPVPPVPPFPASRAGAYLRHMASAPNMPQRPNSTPPQQQRTASRRILLSNDSDSEGLEFYGKRGNGEGEDDTASVISKSIATTQQTWIGTMARAVLFGGSSIRHDRPQLRRRTSERSRPQSPLSPHIQHQPLNSTPALSVKMPELRQTQSSISHMKSTSSTSVGVISAVTSDERRTRGRLSDQSTIKNSARKQYLTPPEIFSRIERGRSGRSETEVSTMRVVCKSAPSSRTTSRVRGNPASEDVGLGALTIGLVAAVSMARNKNDSRDSDHTRVPSLAKTRAEGDAWSKSNCKKGRDRERDRGRRRRVVTDASAYDSDMPVGGMLITGPQPRLDRRNEQDDTNDNQDSEIDEDDEDEDGEPDLAKILGPPKRQNSIKSLRKHLTASVSTTSLASMPSKGSTTSPLTHALPKLTVPEETEMEYTISPAEEQLSGASASLLRAAGLLPPSRNFINLDDPSVLYPSWRESPAGMRHRIGGDVGYDGGESDGNDDGRRELFQRFLRGGSARSANTMDQGSGSTRSGGPGSRLGLPAAWGGGGGT